ncbi:NTP transferase domain-containing protein [Spirosoma utsteinense]|uniref:Probable molybdenum cofactor guanylyltransferase n=1 Tax=Spirosoma utsteinense TaxID=2585773 RepID=A0ABR6W1X5_9BACT|nr:NTP transferase domain-containing protein [Spirosoma utsteinense]MBC3785241.1 molybdopterin-guanine dinucleotide biosynthesis protein A [Spirosoma utsteinense]MBC3790533.1 molybdopterin-guanine dinucleotide biosynthesis protein A [Spirosoma utsteinense]
MNKLNGLLLTGGRSTRMGQDKSQLAYHGKPQREHLTDLLRPYCQDVFWSVNADQAADLAGTDQLLILDAFDWPGPLNGILSAFRQEPAAAWFVVACDMPLLTTRSFDALINGRDPAKPATVFFDSDGLLPEPLLGIYEPAFGPIIDRAVQGGEFSPRRLLQHYDVQLLSVPDRRELTNVNDPAARTRLGF